MRNKESGYSRSSPQNEPQKKTEIVIFDCSGFDKKFNKRETMMSHQKTHEVINGSKTVENCKSTLHLNMMR